MTELEEKLAQIPIELQDELRREFADWLANEDVLLDYGGLGRESVGSAYKRFYEELLKKRNSA
jgi:hypothetical protein